MRNARNNAGQSELLTCEAMPGKPTNRPKNAQVHVRIWECLFGTSKNGGFLPLASLQTRQRRGRRVDPQSHAHVDSHC